MAVTIASLSDKNGNSRDIAPKGLNHNVTFKVSGKVTGTATATNLWSGDGSNINVTLNTTSASIATSDLSGTIATSQIEDGAVTKAKLGSDIYTDSVTDGSSKLLTSNGAYDNLVKKGGDTMTGTLKVMVSGGASELRTYNTANDNHFTISYNNGTNGAQRGLYDSKLLKWVFRIASDDKEIELNRRTRVDTLLDVKNASAASGSETDIRVFKPGSTDDSQAHMTLTYENGGSRGIWDSRINDWVLQINNSNEAYVHAIADSALIAGNANTAYEVRDYSNTSRTVKIGYADTELSTTPTWMCAFNVYNGQTFIMPVKYDNVTVGKAVADANGNAISTTFGSSLAVVNYNVLQLKNPSGTVISAVNLPHTQVVFNSLGTQPDVLYCV